MSILSSDLTTIRIIDLVPCRWQPRQQFDPARLIELAQDIAAHGVLTPLIAWRNERDEYELIAGERRLRACCALALVAVGHCSTLARAIDVVVSADDGRLYRDILRVLAPNPQAPLYALWEIPARLISGSPAELEELALAENLQRQDLTPIEEAHALQAILARYAYTQRELAGRLGKSQTWISQRIALIGLAPDLAGELAAGSLDAAMARDLARLEPSVQRPALDHVRQHRFTSKQAANLVGRLLEQADPAAWSPEAAPNAAHDVTPHRLLIRDHLEHLDPAARQAAVLHGTPRRAEGTLISPATGYDYDQIVAAMGLSDSVVYRSVESPAAKARLAELVPCATCQLNAHRAQVEPVLAAAAEAKLNVYSSRWPRCAPGVATCHAHTPSDRSDPSDPSHGPAAPILLALPDRTDVAALTPAEQAHLQLDPASSGSYRKSLCDDLATWCAIVQRVIATESTVVVDHAARAQARWAEAIAGYIAAQPTIAIDHLYSQPCAHCVSYDPARGDQPCAHQHNPKPDSVYNATHIAAVWSATQGSYTCNLGRCRLYRIPSIDLLPAPRHDRANLTISALVAMLWSMSPVTDYEGRQRSGARWLPVDRTNPLNAPPWSEALPHLRRAIRGIGVQPGLFAALLLAWPNHLAPDSRLDRVDLYDPHHPQGAIVTWQRTAVFSYSSA